MTSAVEDLLNLSHEIGREERGLAMLSEGNTSAAAGDGSFWVKASGTYLSTLGQADIVECDRGKLISLLEKENLTDGEVDAALMDSRLDKTAKKPSVEAVFHAYLLSLPGIKFIGHAHPVGVNRILCSPRARDIADRRMFPDEIVCCGVASVFIPLTDPGLKLAQAIRRETSAFVQRFQRVPRIVLMENHGAIALGASSASVLAAMMMLEKSAQVFAGAAMLGGPNFLSEREVERIAGRPDEIYRQKLLGI